MVKQNPQVMKNRLGPKRLKNLEEMESSSPISTGTEAHLMRKVHHFSADFLHHFLMIFPMVDGDTDFAPFWYFLKLHILMVLIQSSLAIFPLIMVDIGWYDPDVRREGRSKGAFLDPNDLCLAAMIQSLATYLKNTSFCRSVGLSSKHYFESICTHVRSCELLMLLSIIILVHKKMSQVWWQSLSSEVCSNPSDETELGNVLDLFMQETIRNPIWLGKIGGWDCLSNHI